MDPHLTFKTHIKHLCKNTYYHLRNIAKLRPTLCQSDAEKLVHAFVFARMDYYRMHFSPGSLARTYRGSITFKIALPGP